VTEKWYQVVAHADQKLAAQHLPPEITPYLKGEIGEIIVFSIPTDMRHEERFKLMQVIRAMAESAGSPSVIVIDDSVKMMRLKALDGPTSKILDRRLRDRKTDGNPGSS
jgi:hypothetical protein